MGNIGRIFCVALPFILTVASLIAMLVAGLSGVTDKSMYLFKVNTTDLSISSSSITSLLSSRGLHERDLSDSIIAATSGASSDTSDLISSATSAAEAAGVSSAADAESAISGLVSGTNITASDLGLADAYLVSLWGYCEVSSSGDKTCEKAQFDWASNATSSFQAKLDSVAGSSGENVTLPDSIKTAMNTFSTVTKWTEVVFIIAYIALGISLFLGIFANCSRAFSCCTFIIAALAAVAVCAAAALATAMASVVVGAVEGTAKAYGVTGSINTRFLAAVWIGAAFAIAAAFFWMFTICCCAPDHKSSRGKSGGFGRKKHLDDAEKLPMSGAYAPLSEPHQNAYGNGHDSTYGNTAYGGGGFGQGASYGNPRTGRNDMAYEPYQHRS
ncbi:integral membrane protein [Diaporthe eres]|uniref:SUR7 protein n=1 Tax=Diaporthe vaccinii TaxID=105482 RepID=A0ABR4EZB4_9PEZI|nr:integral membrane protein [Diaporthe eres]